MEHQLLLLWLLALPAAAGPAAQPVASLFYGSLLALPVSPAALGAFEVGISVNDVEVQVTVPAGADADVVAKHVGAQHGLSADGTSVVARTILSRSAELSGKSLAYVLPVKIGGHHGTVHLPVYSGESHEDLAAGFIARYGLQQTVARQLVGVMVSHEQAKATQGAAAPSSASPSPRTGSDAHDQAQLKAAADKAAQVAQAAALQKQAEEREQRERAAKEQQEREAAQELERAVKEQQEREAAQERVRVATGRTEKEEAEKAARVKQQQMQEKVAKAKVEAFKAQQRAATGDNDMDSSEIDVQRLRREQKKQAVAGLDAKTKLDEQKKAESVLDAAEEEKSEMMEEAVPPQGQGSREGKAKAALDAAEEEKLEMMEEVVSSQVEASGADRASAHSVAMADVGQTPHTEQPAKRRTDEVQTDKRDTVVRKANSRVVHEQLKRPLRNSHAGNEGDEYLLPHYTQEEAAKMQEEELRKRVAACTSLGCAVREHLQISRTTSLVVGIVAATVGACMLLDRYGIENTSCCRRSHSAEELRRIRQIGALDNISALRFKGV